jgi:hypothetical protein
VITPCNPTTRCSRRATAKRRCSRHSGGVRRGRMALWSSIRTLFSSRSERDPRIEFVDGGFDVISFEEGHAMFGA